MRWYEKLYVGEKARKNRYSVIRAVRNGEPMGYYILTPPSNEKNLLDIYPALALKLPYYKDRDILIIGVASDFQDAARLSARIVEETYKKTGGFDVMSYLLGDRD